MRKQGSGEIPLSMLFDKIVSLSSKGYLLYGFMPGKWVAGEKEFTLRSDAFTNDLAFLIRQGYVRIEKKGEIIRLSPSGVAITEHLVLPPKLEALVRS